MGFWRNLFAPAEMAAALDSAPTFTTSPGVDLEPEVARAFGIELIDPGASGARVDRRTAMTVPAVKRSRDLIAGTLGAMPLDVIGPRRAESTSTLLEQPEKDRPRSVTMTRTLEDMLFESVAWWRVVEWDWTNYPRFVKRLPPREVTVNEQTGAVYWRGKRLRDDELIRFDSPNDALLVAGGRAIRTCLALDQAANRAADGTPPVDYFTPTEEADPLPDGDVVDLLDAWQEARRKRSTGYVPAALKYNVAGWDPKTLQLAEQRQHAVLEIARLAGIDPEELGVSTTTRTYANAQDRRKNFLDFTLGGYRQAVEDRLSMGDVTPRGHFVRFNVSAFLRSDDKTRMEVYEIGLRTGVYADADEIRELEDKPPLTDDQRANRPAPAPAEEPAS